MVIMRVIIHMRIIITIIIIVIVRGSISKTHRHHLLLEEPKAKSEGGETAVVTKSDVDTAVLEFVAPLLFTDAHDLSVTFSLLQVIADKSPDAPGGGDVQVTVQLTFACK